MQLVLEIAWGIRFAVEEECGWFVYHGACRCEDVRGAGKRCVQGRRVDEGLEYRTRLPFRQRAVELADPVIAAADQRLDLAGPRVYCHQCYLRPGNCLCTLFRTAADQLVHLLHPGAHGLGCVPLQVHVQRGIHAVGIRLEVVLLELILQGVVHQIHEVRRIRRLRSAPRNHHRF